MNESGIRRNTMFTKAGFLLSILFSLIVFQNCYAFENLFYALRGDASLAIERHHQQINGIIDQAYFTNHAGEISGEANPRDVATAQKYHIPFIAQVSNYEFDERKVHEFLSSSTLQTAAIQNLVRKCVENKFAGIQVDFEGMSVKDKDAFTAFIAQLAQALHSAHLQLSVVAIPVLYQEPPTYYYKLFQREGDAYDLKALANVVDFISLMTYDQHRGYTTPGPVAGLRWVQKALQLALQEVPKAKLSLGIPTYSAYWRIRKDGEPADAKGVPLSYESVLHFIKEYNLSMQWVESDQIHYIIFAPFLMYRYIFVEDAPSFKAKLNLATSSQLRGISVFRVGTEDPKIWDLL
jgi:spore germination protein